MDGSVVGPVLTTDSSGWNGLYGMHRADLLRCWRMPCRLPPFIPATAACTSTRMRTWRA